MCAGRKAHRSTGSHLRRFLADIPECSTGQAEACAGVAASVVPGGGMGKLGKAAEEAAKVAAAPKIAAAWGASVYRHGGLMSAIEHINYRHAFGSGFSGVSRFAEGASVSDVKGYVDYVLRNGTITDRGMIGDVGKVIGTDVAGNPVSGLEVIVRYGMIKTAFPVAVP